MRRILCRTAKHDIRKLKASPSVDSTISMAARLCHRDIQNRKVVNLQPQSNVISGRFHTMSRMFL